MSPSRWSRTLAAVLLVTGCTHDTPHARQKAVLAHLSPVELATPAQKPDAAPRTVIKVLVLADDDYRNHSLHYEEEILRLFESASRYSLPALGVRFEVISIRAWSHRAGTAPLAQSLADLEAAEPGEGVDLVAGLVSALTVVDTNHDSMGMARILGKHLVMRGADDGAEMAALLRELRALDDSERDAFYRKRKQHKLSTLLLHEWGHGLGAPHDPDNHGLMHPFYSLVTTAFSASSLALINASLAARALPTAQRAGRLREQLERLRPGELFKEELPAWLEALRELEKGEPAAPRQGPLTTREDIAAIDRAVKLYNASLYVEAQQQLAPVLAKLPADGTVRALSCQLALAIDPTAPATLEGCQTGASAATASARPRLFLAQALLHVKQHKQAVEALRAARTQLEARQADDEPHAWPLLAIFAHRASCVSLAEEAVAHAPDREELQVIKTWVTTSRRWSGLPRPSDDCERDHLDRFREAQALLGKDNLGAAAKRIGWFKPGPARDSLDCELALRKGGLKDARRSCERTIAAWPQSSLGHYLLGVIAELEKRPAEVAEHLAQVVELDPGVDDAYVRLAAALRSLGKTEALEQLGVRFKARFNKPLR